MGGQSTSTQTQQSQTQPWQPAQPMLLNDLHVRTFLDCAPLPDFEIGQWWVSSEHGRPVAFAGMIPSSLGRGIAYLSRVGVIRECCGHGLQRRLMRTIEQRARRSGLYCIVSDTTGNIISANNFIRCGYVLFQPEQPWAWRNSLYWRKVIGSRCVSYGARMRRCAAAEQGERGGRGRLSLRQ